ncbi:ABC transporter permease [Ekhidna sp.]|uniref:ABC transporter permease n=1 Tax=Ekhidna sp. TaxID=2608089 RepID=UPI003B5ABDBD
MKKPRPPKFADRILSWFIKGQLLEEILGDLHEYHEEELMALPNWKRVGSYWYHVFHFLRPNLLRSVFGTKKLNYLGMIKLNFKIALRSLQKNRTIAIPSLLTLVFGTLCFQCIYSWSNNELSMDDFHQKFDRIYMGAVQTNPLADVSPVSPQLLFRIDYDQYPEVENKLLIHIYEKDEIKIINEGQSFNGKGLIADSTFFSFFDFPIRDGYQAELLNDPSHIVLSGNFANRVFGDVNPIGKTLKVSCDQEGLYTVAAVTEKLPANSSISFDFVVPRHSQRFWRRIPMDLILVNEDFASREFNEKVSALGRENNERFPESQISYLPIADSYFTQPLDVALFGKYGNSNTVQTLIFIGLAICLITFLGFNNLQSTQLLYSAEKFGIKQMIGGSKGVICVEMIIERLIYFVLAVGITFLIFEALFPYYTTILNLDLDANPIFDGLSIIAIIGSIISISIIISLVQLFAMDVKDAVSGGKNLFKIPRMQRTITTIQYTVTITLMILTTVVFIQYRFMSTKDPGFNHQNIVSVNFFEMSANDNQVKGLDYLRDKLKSNTPVAAFSQGDLPVNAESFLSSWKKTGEENEYESRRVMIVSPGYLDLLGIDMLEGRFFSDSLDTSGEQKVVINEAAKKYWGINDISTQKLTSNTSGRQEFDFDIIGVVEDFHFEHLSKKIEPLVLRFRTYPDDRFLVRFDGSQQAGISFLEELYGEINPNSPFDYELLDDQIIRQYAKEKQLSKVYIGLTMVALILSSISLFTFSLYETRRRTKEIGIRKVNGASALQIIYLLSSSFLKSVAIAFLIALPFAWYFANQWIQEFAYRTTIGSWVFIAAGCIASLVATVAIIWHVMNVSKQNPVESLRYE